MGRPLLPPRATCARSGGSASNVVDDWFGSSLSSQHDDTLLDHRSMIFGLLRPETFSDLVRQHGQGRHDNHKLLFSLVALEWWMRAFVPASV